MRLSLSDRHSFTVNDQIQFHLFSTALFVDVLYHISPKSNNKYNEYKQKLMQIQVPNGPDCTEFHEIRHYSTAA